MNTKLYDEQEKILRTGKIIAQLLCLLLKNKIVLVGRLVVEKPVRKVTNVAV